MGMIAYFTAIPSETLDELRADESQVEALLFPDDEIEPDSLDVDKAWHGIHYLLTGTAYGGEGYLAQAILGGEEIGDDLGYGPVRFLTAEQVKQVADALSQLTLENLASRYQPEEMDKADVYPGIWVRDGSDGLEYLLSYFESLQTYYQQATHKGNAMLLYVA